MKIKYTDNLQVLTEAIRKEFISRAVLNLKYNDIPLSNFYFEEIDIIVALPDRRDFYGISLIVGDYRNGITFSLDDRYDHDYIKDIDKAIVMFSHWISKSPAVSHSLNAYLSDLESEELSKIVMLHEGIKQKAGLRV